MKKYYLFGLILLGATAPSSQAWAKLEVLTTTTTLAAVAREVGGEWVEVKSVTKGSQDPHFVETKPSYMVQARGADLLLAVGLDLEVGWISNITRGSRNPKIMEGSEGYLAVGSLIDALEVPKGKIDRSQGDVHPLGNPHFVLDPLRVGKAALGIAKKMGQLDPAHAGDFEKNARVFQGRLETKTKEWTRRIQASGIDKVVTNHRTLDYFLSRFHLALVDSIEAKPGIPPTAKHILSLIDEIRSQKVSCLLVESFFETAPAERIAKNVPIHIERVAPEVDAEPDTETYEKLLETIVTSVENCGRFQKGVRHE